jgi:hypothetical protein
MSGPGATVNVSVTGSSTKAGSLLVVTLKVVPDAAEK